MTKGKRNFVIGISILLFMIIISGCFPNKQGGFSCVCAPLISKIQSMLTGKKSPLSATASSTASIAADTGPSRPHPPVRTGDITTGTKVEAVSQTIGPSGGTIEIAKSGDPLDGFVIDVPSGAFPDNRTFKVSSAPISKQTFGDDINPISPMITVDNGGGYAAEIMYVRVPVKVPEGNFAMGFLYDDGTKQLEGMPLVGMDGVSVTIATRHFSSFFISMIEKALLKNDTDSGFRPGIDDWQFTNRGSYISPSGHCEGQSLTAMWYYCTGPDGKDACLYGRYDNNGRKPATPELWQDDSLGYRLCSVIQQEKRLFTGTTFENFWDNLAGISWELKNNKWVYKRDKGISDEATFNLFAYSIRATGEPQEVAIWRNAGDGHAMIVYKIIGNALYVADPNYPGNTERKIIYYSGDGKFKPYQSGANREEIEKGNSIMFDKIVYCGKSTIVSWDTISQRWADFKNGSIGNNIFPRYKLVFRKDNNDPFKDLKDGMVFDVNKIVFAADCGDGYIAACNVFRNGKQIFQDLQYRTELEPGLNTLGLYVLRIPDGAAFGKYIDFQYINIIFGALTIDPPSLVGEPNKEYTFTAKTENPPAKARFEWAVDGAVQKTTTNVLKYKFGSNPSYNITCKLYDDAMSKDKSIGDATATVTIQSKVSGDKLALLHERKFLSGYINIDGTRLITYKNGTTKTETRNTSNSWGYLNAGTPITWEGTIFTAKNSKMDDGGTWNREITGTVSADGNTLTSFKCYEYANFASGIKQTSITELINLPIRWTQGSDGKLHCMSVLLAGNMGGTTLNQYIQKLDYIYESKDRTERFTQFMPSEKSQLYVTFSLTAGGIE